MSFLGAKMLFSVSGVMQNCRLYLLSSDKYLDFNLDLLFRWLETVKDCLVCLIFCNKLFILLIHQGSYIFSKVKFKHFLSMFKVHFQAFPTPYRGGKLYTFMQYIHSVATILYAIVQYNCSAIDFTFMVLCSVLTLS